MAQRLRVAGWLRFGNKAQLARGLRAFEADAAPGHYDADRWEVEGTDARIVLDTELPGDFEQVERPFMAMVLTAAFGYVDYFEQGNDRMHWSRLGPVRRWAAGSVDKRTRTLPREGTASLPFAEKEDPWILRGALKYPDERTLSQALGQLPFRLPHLTPGGARELRLGAEVFVREGASLSVDVSVRGPGAVIEGQLGELLRLLSAKATGGRITAAPVDPQQRALGRVVQPGGKTSRPPATLQPSASALDVFSDEASAKLAGPGAGAGGEPAPAKAAPKPRPWAPRRDAAEGQELDAAFGPVAGAAALSGGRFVTWGGRKLVIGAPGGAAPPRVVSLARGPGGDFAWPVAGVTELPGDRMVVFHEMDGDLDLVDLGTGERRVVAEHKHTVRGVLVVEGRMLSWSVDGTVRTLGFDGSPGHLFEVKPPRPIDQVLPLGDGTFVMVSDRGASRWEVATGEKRAELGDFRAVHDAGEGRFLLEKSGEFELWRGDERLSRFTLQKGESHQFLPLSSDTLVATAHSRQILLVTLPGGEHRAVPTGHAKYIGRVHRAGADRFLSHARSLPGLNERVGFDGVVKLWDAAFSEVGALDVKAPVAAAVPLGDGRFGLLLDDPLRGREVPVLDAIEGKIVQTIKGHKKSVVGALALPGAGLLTWSKDGAARLTPLG